MKKIIISFLLIQLTFCAASTSLTIEPVSNKIVDEITTADFFSVKITPDGDDPTLEGTDIDGKLKLGEATLANCEADGSNWKCKPSVKLSYGKHTLTKAESNTQIKSLAVTITDSKKEVEIIYAILAEPKTTKVTSAIAANSDIEIKLTANSVLTAAVAGTDLSNYFQLGTIKLGTCSETGLANAAIAGTEATIKCKNAAEIPLSNTPYALTLQSGKTDVNSMSIGTSGSVTVSSSSSTNEENKGDDKNSSFYLKNYLLILLTILF